MGKIIGIDLGTHKQAAWLLWKAVSRQSSQTQKAQELHRQLWHSQRQASVW